MHGHGTAGGSDHQLALVNVGRRARFGTEEEIYDFYKTRLAGYKRPRRIFFRPEDFYTKI